MAIDGPSPRMQNSEAALAECTELEAEIAGLRAAYDQYFSGIERVAPLKRHEALKKRLTKLKSSFIKQTAVKFRVNGLYAKYLTYERQWAKTMEQRESGTYRPDLERARRRAKQREEQEQRRKSAGAGAAVRGVLEIDPSEDVDLDDFDFGDDEVAAPSAPVASPASASTSSHVKAPASHVMLPPSEDEFDALLDALSEAPSPAPPPASAGPRSAEGASSSASVPRIGVPTPDASAPRRAVHDLSAPIAPAPASSASGLTGAPLPTAPRSAANAGPPLSRPDSSAGMLSATAPAQGPAMSGGRSTSGAAIPAVPRPGAVPPAPAASAAARPAAPGARPTTSTGTPQAVRAAGGAVSDQKLQAVYEAYVMAKRRCNEDTSQLSFEKVAGDLRREVGQLTREGGARAVEFKVVIKDGRAELRTIAKE